jgi:hypothetical protein
VKLRTIVVFGAGYVLGSRAGHERYKQIVEVARRLGQRLEERRSTLAAQAGGSSSDTSDPGSV